MSQPENAPEPVSAPAGVANQLAIENAIEIYKITADWIRFADAKAAVVLAVAGTLGGLLIPYLKPYLDRINDGTIGRAIGTFTLCCFAAWLLLLVGSVVYAFLCIIPYRQKGKHPALELCKHFHGAAIGAAYKADQGVAFFESYRSLGHEDILREVLAGILIDAHISNRKYGYVTASIKLFSFSSIFGFLFLLLSQFSSL